MSQAQPQEILDAIKTDSLILFADYTQDCEDLSIGRFPLLSLCYLYNAKKIIKNFENKLLKISEYKKTPEIYEIYLKFKEFAGRSLRLYLDDSSIISPIEMLAILHKDNKVKKLYLSYTALNLVSETLTTNLQAIYTINKQSPKIEGSKINITRYPLSKKQKKIWRISIASATALILIVSTMIVLINTTIGFGTISSPYKINSSKQLLKALNSKSHYVVTKDITLDDLPNDTTFKGYIEGNNHTITINESPYTSFITHNKGSLTNLALVYTDIEKEISSEFSLLTTHNTGTIDNVSITCNSLNLHCLKNAQDINIAGFALDNSGDITNCNLFIVASITSSDSGECNFSGFSAKNGGKINNCIILENSKINTFDSDAAGICATNNTSGKIQNCKNYATISQNSNTDEWSPNVAGITISNYGTIENCINYGDLTIESSNNSDNASGNVLIGGISALNYNQIKKSLNKGNITAKSTKIVIYAGGISAYSQYFTSNQTQLYPLIDNCGANGNLNISTENEKAFAFAGGISGYFYGKIKDSFSLSTFTNSFTTEKYFFGNSLGSCSVQYTLWGGYICSFEASNNYMLSQLNIDYHIGALIYGNTIIQAGTNITDGIATIATETQLKSQSVYWED